MVFKFNPNKTLKDLENRINELEESKKIYKEENQLLFTFLFDELGSSDLDNLRELLAGKKLTEIIDESENRRREIQNLTSKKGESSNLSFQFKYLEEKINEHEKEAKAKQETINDLEELVREQGIAAEVKKITINALEEKIRELEELTEAKAKTIYALEEKIKEREEEAKTKQLTINYLEEKINEREVGTKIKQDIISN
ncbi:19561_t:CDS:1 [Funneliformis geosporum]|uniref:19561_t:CDS:1 n=1 Tax=Funneliformis geosporum TaxID=1117311 RepID=A0A9W4X634_9GLOM|nr:19561_t:CDS:1 [Funneliformis geosporum]